MVARNIAKDVLGLQSIIRRWNIPGVNDFDHQMVVQLPFKGYTNSSLV